MLNPRTFPCPACHEFINESMRACRFCSSPVDSSLAAAAVAHQERINRACNSASIVRNLAGVMWVCFFARLLPLAGLFATFGLLILFFVVPARLVIWLFKYGGIRTEDVDYRRAKRNLLISFVLWLLVPVVQVLVELGLIAAFSSLSG